ncbi:penicillin amidase [Tistlia consotensis]|uniref:Penicillin amidase n=1 Tax=Tistlia consotensis USBA 355 TaxID=560819 RepID=A0A1Y6CR58_9PROT|nr:penicillin acylase family protein [Tistlia consotensis]SMF82690.1 penicillin amidase [Tistlia consotensis USBA 355]SNS29878.1 penicillin amidase [Tistlia consotensis]
MAGKLAALVSALVLGGRAAVTGLPAPSDRRARLAAFPTRGLPLEGRVTVRWNERMVPFVEAGSDRDGAFVLGLVHAHLRLGQMETLRRVSQGRIAEMVGPFATDIDRSLRILGLGRAAPAIVAALPAATRDWLEAYLEGVNHYLATCERLPHEFALFGLEREPWRAEEVVTLGRLVSTDVNWLVWFGLLKQRARPDWPGLWARLVAAGSNSTASYHLEEGAQAALLEAILAGASRSGSNAVAVAGTRSRSGGALLAGDPHLGVSQPNAWIIAGYRTPSTHAVGFMAAGLPFVAIGRNPWIAWGGTNLRSANSDLIDVSGLPPEAFETERQTIKVRGWRDAEVAIRHTVHGPVITDAPLLKADGLQAALTWIGHRPSDELSALLAVNRARNWEEFRAGLEGYAVSPQNFVYADAAGDIGQVMATRLPARPKDPPAELLQPPEAAAHWQRILGANELPQAFRPETGLLASANNRGAEAEVPVGWFFSTNDRVERLYALLAAGDKVGVEDLVALQQDVYMASAVALRDLVVARAEGLPLDGPAAGVLASLRDWDGHYRADSRGALAFEQTLVPLTAALFERRDLAAFESGGRAFQLIGEELSLLPDARLRPALAEALGKAAAGVARFGDWGGQHRMVLQHPLGGLPLLGRRYRFLDYPVAGSSSTVMKTAHRLTAERHPTGYGSQARHISDLSDPDANWFVLLGGQDGWFGSEHFLDQVELWRAGEYVQVPLSPGDDWGEVMVLAG